MINTTILFYNVGLSDKNLAYDWNALNRILAAGIITDNGQAYELHLTALPFGQVFNISQDVYDKVKTATYIVIENTDPEKPNATPDARACFINNFLQLANGNWSVSYTIDDWASYYLNPDSPYNIHIDGFTERANVPLISAQNNSTFLNTRQIPLTGKTNDNLIKTFFNTNMQFMGINRNLPNGWKCQVYSIDIPKYDGTSHDGANSHGYIGDYDYKSDTIRLIERLNSNLYLNLFDENGYAVPIIYIDNNNNIAGLPNDITINIPNQSFDINTRKSYTIFDPDDSTIIKIMTFDFLPCIDGKDNQGNIKPFWANSDNLTNIFQIKTLAEIYPNYSTWQGADRKILFVNKDLTKLNCADIYVKEDPYTSPVQTYYFKAVGFEIFSNILKFNLPNEIKAENSTIIKQTNLSQYYLNSLYGYIDEVRQIKIKYLTAEMIIPIAQFIVDSCIYVEFSGDLDTIIMKYNNIDLPINYKSNDLASTGQNTAFFDLVHVRDYKAYKNAKITGTAAVAATAISGIVGFGTSAASVARGNAAGVAGMVGSLSGSAQGIIAGVQKLQGLTPAQLSPANGDYTLTQIITDENNLNKMIFEISQPSPENFKSIMRNFEENGAAVEMPFDEYIDKCQMQAFNAIKMSIIDVTGAPQQICRRIEEMLLSGVTLWTGTDVGNKKVINYPLATVSA